MSNKELLAEAISKLSKEELSAIYPPITRNNFVVRKSWLGRNQIITFNTKSTKTQPSIQVTYNHDEVLNVMLPKLGIMPCWIKREYWSQSTDMPTNVRHLSERVVLDAIKSVDELTDEEVTNG
tara:strand:+ start:87 stop:455 length:369 start_codon:yes stop_codon:yes gene_type:complete